MANTAFRAKSRVRLPWLIKCLLCGLDCAMIRRLCGSFLMTGENSLENTLRPPFISPLSPSLTNACITRGSVFKPDSLSLYQPFDTLVAEINTIIFRTVITVPSCAWYGTYSTAIALEVENIHCYIIYHSHSPTESEHISKLASRGYQLCYTSS